MRLIKYTHLAYVVVLCYCSSGCTHLFGGSRCSSSCPPGAPAQLLYLGTEDAAEAQEAKSWLRVYSKCWTETAALSSPELHPSLSEHLPECQSLSCLGFATQASHAKTLTYLASFEWLRDLPPLHHCKLIVIVMSLQPNQLLENLHKTSHEEQARTWQVQCCFAKQVQIEAEPILAGKNSQPN